MWHVPFKNIHFNDVLLCPTFVVWLTAKKLHLKFRWIFGLIPLHLFNWNVALGWGTGIVLLLLCPPPPADQFLKNCKAGADAWRGVGGGGELNHWKRQNEDWSHYAMLYTNIPTLLTTWATFPCLSGIHLLPPASLSTLLNWNFRKILEYYTRISIRFDCKLLKYHFWLLPIQKYVKMLQKINYSRK